MKWLIDNWTLLVVLFCLVGVGFHYFKKFCSLPSDEQLEKVKAFLLSKVIEAEKTFGGNGTGKLKLSCVYAMFIEAFPSLVAIIPFNVFAALVDEVLEEMRHLLETNEAIANYVNEDK